MTYKSFLLAAAACGALCPLAAGAVPKNWVKALPAARTTVGTGNVAVIDPPVRHPAETPCVVSLYHNAVFGGNNVNFTYTPPANCPGPYATIVLSVNVSLDAGIQYDRTGTIWVGGVPLWFGTTSEPSPTEAPSWHFERDVTDYTSTLSSANTGFVLIANYTNPTDTSLITSSAQLLFYPATSTAPAPRVPDLVLPLNPGGGTVALGSPSNSLTLTPASLPTNIVAATMDVYLQGQSTDEFWYTCVPTALAGELQSCGNGALREGYITVDGQPAGVAPVSPWIFTGGIDPYLWTPIPGVETLDFKPFQVDLTPFAGVLSNGQQHTFGLSVYGADNYFSVAGALKLYLDPNSTQVTGGVTRDTLSPLPIVKTTNNITSTSAKTSGMVYTGEVRNFEIDGTVTASAGTTTYAVKQSGSFSNEQNFDITGSLYVQAIKQNTTTTVQEVATGPNGTKITTTTHTTPLNVLISEVIGAKGFGTQATKITQDFADTKSVIVNGAVNDQGYTNNTITTQDTLDINFNKGVLTGNSGQSSSARYLETETGEPCYGLSLTSSSGLLTASTPGCQ